MSILNITKILCRYFFKSLFLLSYLIFMLFLFLVILVYVVFTLAACLISLCFIFAAIFVCVLSPLYTFFGLVPIYILSEVFVIAIAPVVLAEPFLMSSILLLGVLGILLSEISYTFFS